MGWLLVFFPVRYRIRLLKNAFASTFPLLNIVRTVSKSKANIEHKIVPGLASLYDATPYASMRFWKPLVNLLVLLNVGGSSLVLITFKNDGMELPHALYQSKNKNHLSVRV